MADLDFKESVNRDTYDSPTEAPSTDPLSREEHVRIMALRFAMEHGHPGEDGGVTVTRAHRFARYILEGKEW